MRTAYLVTIIAPATTNEINEASEVVALGVDATSQGNTTGEAQSLLSDALWIGYAFVSIAYSESEAKDNVASYFAARNIYPSSIQVLDLSENKLRLDLLPDAKTRKMPRMVSKLDPLFVLADSSKGQCLELAKFCRLLFSREE